MATPTNAPIPEATEAARRRDVNVRGVIIVDRENILVSYALSIVSEDARVLAHIRNVQRAVCYSE
jgi:hypothetical protein